MMLIQIGNSSVPPVWVTIDTSGFFSWVLCSPCYPFSFTCSYNLSFNYQVATEYNCSATLKCPDIYQVSCYNDYCFSGYIYTADYGALPDYVLSDVISLSPSLTYPLVYIGCLVVTNTGPYPLGNAYGSFSLGKHPLSLVNQIGVRSFTYCLQYLSSAENSTIYFGDDAKIWVPLVSTPFYNLDSTVYYFTPLYNSGSSGYYWLTLLSFTVGPQIIDFPGATPQTGGNVIIEPSTFLTSLPTNMVAEIVDAIVGFMHFPRAYTLEAELGLSLCYNVTNSADWYLSTPLFLANFVGGSLPLLFENIFFQVF
ncbi:hypothetical protein M569_14727 [Genlisea aurea]|uniref:Peptidase A1 domain-containing protein n=1 Tax=Genlisea aurea TaxID=192259 RepID=S8DKP1_9LAMI|nr:hypothetical protein M569_14727 [Genlisea aurea]